VENVNEELILNYGKGEISETYRVSSGHSITSPGSASANTTGPRLD
jgi:hypothetical protein